MARKALARSPGVTPCVVGPTTSDGAIVPENEPDAAAGHAGLMPPHRKIMTPPATWTSPKWMCEKIASLVRFLKVSVKVIVPSSWITARNVAEPLLLIAGTSSAPRRLAVRTVTSSSDATVTTLKQRTLKTRNASFFMLESLLPTGNLRKLVSEGNPKRHHKINGTVNSGTASNSSTKSVRHPDKNPRLSAAGAYDNAWS